MGYKLIALILLLIPSVVFGAPGQPSVSGTISTGSTATISGSAFGSHALAVESLQSNIESGTTGNILSKTGWTHTADSDWNAHVHPLYATDYAHSGGKSLKCADINATDATQYECIFSYALPSAVTVGQNYYATWWVRYSGSWSTLGQWKIFRTSRIRTVGDGIDEILLSTQPNTGWNYFTIHPGTESNQVVNANFIPAVNAGWSRVELTYNAASSTGTLDGSINYRITSDSGTVQTQTLTGLNTHPFTNSTWEHAIWQNYLGNGTGTASIWFDDMYVQYNTPARVELCAGSTWANRGKCEIQVPTAWESDGTEIIATVNTGNFAAGSTAYVYVVDSTGTANTLGTAVEIGAGEVEDDTTPPVRSLLAPSGALSAGTTSTTISLTTDEAATCKYSATPGTAYSAMTLSFDSSYAMSHSATVSGLTNGSSYNLYVRCINGSGYANTTDSTISFSVASSAGTAGTLSWQYSTYSAERADVRIPINIIRTGGSTGTVTAQWSSNGQTATHDVDYYGNDNVTVTFADGVTSMPVNTYGSGDDGIEMIANGADYDRYFQMILTNPTGGATLGTTLATVTIEGDYVEPNQPTLTGSTTGTIR